MWDLYDLSFVVIRCCSFYGVFLGIWCVSLHVVYSFHMRSPSFVFRWHSRTVGFTSICLPLWISWTSFSQAFIWDPHHLSFLYILAVLGYYNTISTNRRQRDRLYPRTSSISYFRILIRKLSQHCRLTEKVICRSWHLFFNICAGQFHNLRDCIWKGNLTYRPLVTSLEFDLQWLCHWFSKT